MYALAIRPEVDKILKKIVKKNRRQYEIIMNKVEEILNDPQHYKNLRAPLNHWKRVHIDSSFVLVFSVEEKSKTVVLEDYDHHDNIYR